MSEIDNGGPAFPYKPERSEPCGPDGWVRVTPGDMPGMTLRDYFAAQAVQGLLAAGMAVTSDQHMFARDAYAIADAMLEARK